MQVLTVELHTLMTAAGPGVGAEDHIALVVANHRVGAADLGDHIQIQQKIPAGKPSVNGIGGSQVGNDLRVLPKVGDGGAGEKFLHLKLKGGPEDHQSQQQNGGSRGEVTAEGAFHAYSTSNL